MNTVLGGDDAQFVPDIVVARNCLRGKQADAVTRLGGTPFSTATVTKEALDAYRRFTAVTTDAPPGAVRRGAYLFDRDVELGRVARGQEILRRIDPGPCED